VIAAFGGVAFLSEEVKARSLIAPRRSLRIGLAMSTRAASKNFSRLGLTSVLKTLITQVADRRQGRS